MNKFLTYIFIFLFSFTSSVNAGYSDAINRGKTGAGIFSLKNFGNENTNGMSKTEWIVANADKDTISNGTLGLVSDLYNTATKKGEGEPFIISSVLTGLVVAGSLYSIQDSARKIYAWFDGEGYNGKTTYIDPIDGRIYTAEGNIKEGAIELGAAATAGIVVKGVGKVVSKATKVPKNTKITGSKSVNVVNSVLSQEISAGAKVTNPIKSINKDSLTKHFIDRMKERNVAYQDIKDAIKNPLGVSKIKIDSAGPSYKIIGKKATVVVNPKTNTLITTYKTTSNLKKLEQVLNKLK